ncbi:MAG: TetR/AcrR family transcriptional regulator [Proteobacteria bacterium]|nr:TetR/AcrR family transcriptional regulator [Pseudomonadota bacterium]
MQHKKNSIRNRILKAAAEEFEQKGFFKTNIREVVKKAGTSIGNLYAYFDNKDALFYELVNPTVKTLEKAIAMLEKQEYLLDAYKWGFEWHKEIMVEVARFIEKNRRNLSLLFFKSQGSKLEDYKERFIERYTELSKQMIKITQEMFPESNISLSDFFIHCHVSFNISLVGEILMHNVPYEEMLEYFNEFVTFEYYGFKPLMDDYKFVPFLRKN